MKKKLLLFWVAFSLLALHSPAQSYPNYAWGGIMPNTTGALVRTYSPTQAVAYYQQGGHGVISLVGMGGAMPTVELEQYYVVYDMEIVNNYLFMCGQYKYGEAFLAWLDLSDLSNSTASITYIRADKATILRRMVAYMAPSGVLKVVAVGEEDYMWPDWSTPGYPSMWDDCYDMGGTPIPSSSIFRSCLPPYTCFLNFVVEFDDPQTLSTTDYKFVATHDSLHAELVHDVVLTDNYVVFVGEQGGIDDILSLHRCDKNQVIATFDDYYEFPVPAPEGMTWYISCHMKDDTIAVVSRGASTLGPIPHYETRLRVVDAATMTMTSSQQFDYGDFKSDPTDIVYTPGTQTLVLLQELNFPSTPGSYNYAFLHLKPYVGIPIYYAEGMAERTRCLSFCSMDRVPDGKHYISTGGDYWMINNSLSGMATTDCRIVATQKVYEITNSPSVMYHYPYKKCQVRFSNHSYNKPVTDKYFVYTCVNTNKEDGNEKE